MGALNTVREVMATTESLLPVFIPAPFKIDEKGEAWLDGNGFPLGTSELTCCLHMFSKGVQRTGRLPVTPEDRFIYLKRAIDLVFNVPGSMRRVIWNEWTESILRELIGGWGDLTFVALAGSASSGKCFSPETRILFHDGSVRNVSEVKVGDALMGDDGGPRIVMETHSGSGPMFRVTQDNGDSWECNDRHELVLRRRFTPKKSIRKKGMIEVVEMRDYLEKSDTFKHQRAMKASGFDFPEQPTPFIDPRVYGIWLGDGHTNAPRISVAHGDPLTVQYLYDWADRDGWILTKLSDGKKPRACDDFSIQRPVRANRESNQFQDFMLSSMKDKVKFIRDEYLLGSKKVRMQVLAGLIDSDGYAAGACGKPTYFEIACKHESFKDQVAFLARSLGFKVSTKLRMAKCQSGTFPSWRINIIGATGTIPTLRKKCEPSVRHCLPVKFSVQPLGDGEYVGFKVGGNHQFLLWNGTVVHNSDTVALYGLMSYWARPTDTYFIVMSTTKLSARGRIWKSINQFWGQAVDMGCPGKLIDSDGYIKGINQKNQLTRSSGIILMAAGTQDADAACKEIQGLKNPNFIVAADEFSYLGDGILRTAWQNLSFNEKLLFCGMSNPDKITDPFGELSEPKNGWKSVTDDDYRWQTRYGTCLRLNGERSPRILHPEMVDKNGRHLLHWQPDEEKNERIATDQGGKMSRGYFQFVKAFWCPDGSPNNIYSEVELMQGCTMDDREPVWDEGYVVFAGLDPAYTRGGDRSFTVIGKLGKVKGRTHLHICHYEAITEDVKNVTEDLTLQIVRKWVQLCKDWGVKPIHAALDNTGNNSFGHTVDREWSPATQKVNFQGMASDRVVMFRSQDCKYYNKNSELWIQPKEFVREGQISGVSKALMAEMVEREFHKKTEGKTLRVESKESAKKRLKRSPDICDAFLLLVDRAIGAGQLQSEEVKKVSKIANNGWSKARDKVGLATSCGRKMRR